MKDLLIKSHLTEAALQAALKDTVDQLAEVAAYGGLISKDVKNVLMVSSGGGEHIKTGIHWWNKYFFGVNAQLWYEVFNSADFLSLPWIDELGPNTLVMLTSKSGSTAEALAVGARLEKTNCKVVCFTQSPEVKIVGYGIRSFYTGHTPQSFHAMLMLHHAFIGGIWAEREGWEHLAKLLSSLAALPTALAKAALANRVRGKAFADNFDKSGITYFIAAGPMQFAGKAFGSCLLEEMLELDVNVFPANHFFHSIVEKQRLKSVDFH